MIPRRSYFLFVATLLAAASLTRAVNTEFDLPGPRIEVKVTRAGKSLPISQVPNLQPADRLWLHLDLPEGQSVHYLLIAAFLRGSTNPPPEEWFTKAETWTKGVREEGMVVTVPKDAQQTLIFLAPETGGDFSTLRSAVRGKPGAFVRASQDLERASLDRTRLERYLSAVKETGDPRALHDRSVLLARSLNIKLDQQCFDKPSEQQVPCLTQNTDQLVMDDPHSQSVVASLTTGPPLDLISAVSATPAARGGAYSAYVGAVVDLAKLMDSFHNAQYQYIPALASPKRDQLNLRLNNPPSFRKPKSVLVIGLPAVEGAQLPPLRAVDSGQVFCLQEPSLVLPVEGAPLVFSTDLAHDFALHIKDKSGVAITLPAVADPARGGFAIDTRALEGRNLDSEVNGTLRGYWGFEPFNGPAFQLRSAHPANWTVASANERSLIVGRKNVLHLRTAATCCVNGVKFQDPQGKTFETTWKALKPDDLEVEVSLEDATAGPATLLVQQFGGREPDKVSVQSYSEASRLDEFVLHAGDRQGILRGTRLDEVTSLELKGITFTPAGLTRADQKDELRLVAPENATLNWHTDDRPVAKISLKDGRVLALLTPVRPARPKVALITKDIQPGPSTATAIRLGNQDVLPQDGRLFFVLKSEIPATFPRPEKIEVAAEDDSFSVSLSLADGNLTLQDSKTVLATLDPLKSFGPSAFGALRFRPIDANGAKGDWQPLTHLVRIPSLKEVRCPDRPDKQCTLSGENLFLIDSVASEPQFTRAIPVPVGFAGSTLKVPRPNGTLLFLKFRDDPSTVNTAVLPVLPEQQ